LNSEILVKSSLSSCGHANARDTNIAHAYDNQQQNDTTPCTATFKLVVKSTHETLSAQHLGKVHANTQCSQIDATVVQPHRQTHADHDRYTEQHDEHPSCVRTLDAPLAQAVVVLRQHKTRKQMIPHASVNATADTAPYISTFGAGRARVTHSALRFVDDVIDKTWTRLWWRTHQELVPANTVIAGQCNWIHISASTEAFIWTWHAILPHLNPHNISNQVQQHRKALPEGEYHSHTSPFRP
jgi:hypothetical protein